MIDDFNHVTVRDIERRMYETHEKWASDMIQLGVMANLAPHIVIQLVQEELVLRATRVLAMTGAADPTRYGRIIVTGIMRARQTEPRLSELWTKDEDMPARADKYQRGDVVEFIDEDPYTGHGMEERHRSRYGKGPYVVEDVEAVDGHALGVQAEMVGHTQLITVSGERYSGAWFKPAVR